MAAQDIARDGVALSQNDDRKMTVKPGFAWQRGGWPGNDAPRREGPVRGFV